MEEQIIQLENNFQKLISKFNEIEKGRYINEVTRIQFLIRQNNNIISEYKPMRSKRGLINGLGSIIKSISGNLDNEDLITLENKLKNNKALIKQRISLTSKILDNFHNILTNVTLQQNSLNAKLNHEIHMQHKELLLVEIVFQAETLNDLFQQISEGITFAQHNMFHTSIMSHSLLKQAISHIPSSQKIDATVTQIIPLIKINLVMESKLTYILQIPIVNKKTFEYLTIIPIIHSYDSFCTYPVSQTLQVLKSEGMRLADRCNKINEYICEELTPTIPPCEKGVILQEDISKCNFTKIHCPEQYIQRISDSIIYVFSQATQQYTQRCSSGLWSRTFKHSIVVSTDECTYEVNGATLSQNIHTQERMSAPQFINITIPKEQKPIFLEGSSKEIEKQLQQLRNMPVDKNEEIFHTNTLVLNMTTIILIVLTFVTLYIIRQRRRKAQEESTETPAEIPLRQVHTFGVPVLV